jgi:hypothetical protein
LFHTFILSEAILSRIASEGELLAFRVEFLVLAGQKKEAAVLCRKLSGALFQNAETSSSQAKNAQRKMLEETVAFCMVGVAAFETMGHEVVKDLVRRYLSTNYF